MLKPSNINPSNQTLLFIPHSVPLLTFYSYWPFQPCWCRLALHFRNQNELRLCGVLQFGALKKTLLWQFLTLFMRVKSLGTYRGVGETSHQGQTVFHGKRFIEAHSSYRVNMNSWLHYSLPGKSHKLLQQNILCHFYMPILHEADGTNGIEMPLNQFLLEHRYK